MRLYLSWRDRDVVDLTVTVGRKVTTALRVWEKTPPPAPKKDDGPALRASGSLQSAERRWTPSFGFAAPSVHCRTDGDVR